MKFKYSIKVDEKIFGGVEPMFKKLSDYGYRAIDTAGAAPVFESAVEEKNYCENFKKLAKQYDVELFQGHAPILINQPESVFLSKEYKERVLRRMERMARLGIKYVAVHGFVPEGLDFFRNGKVYDYKQLEEHNREVNLEFLQQFTSFLKQEGMVFCIENLFAYDIILRHHVASTCADPNEILYYINQLGEDCFGACYDTGHLNHFGGDEYNFITTLGKHLKITHVHESWGKDFCGMDWHHLPGDGDVDWEVIKKGFKEVDYKGTISAEIPLKADKLFDVKLKYVADAFKALLDD